MYQQQHKSPAQTEPEEVTNDPGAQYDVGNSEKFPIHIPIFLQKNAGNPAIKASFFHISYPNMY
jgi:hypothetical protein